MSGGEITALRAAVAFIVAGGYVATMARVAERFGSKLGGLILALPSTVLVGISFIAVSEGHSGLRDASAVLPITIAAATIFLTVFIRLCRFGLLAAYSGSIAAWLLVTVPVAITHFRSFPIAIALSFIIFTLTTMAFRHVPHRSAKPMTQSWKLMAVRFVVAGNIAAATVIVARLAGPIWGAVCASFPAVFSASLFLMAKTHGIEFTTSLGRTMIIGCMANVVFGICVRGFSEWMSSLPTIGLAYAVTLLFGVWAYRFLIEALGQQSGAVVVSEAAE